MIKDRSARKQMAINMVSGICIYVAGMCVSFFLTPFIVSRLGVAAYGFIGLSNNIIGYSALLTVAVNSMAGRFITIKYHEKDICGANAYMSSIFYTNLCLASLIFTVLAILTIFLPKIINIPEDLTADVQTLFIMLVMTSCLSLITGVIGVSCFIKNRLDLQNMRNLTGTLIRVTLLLALFGLCTPRLWYFGVSSIIMTIYVICTNWRLLRRLTPELKIRWAFFDWGRLKEVVSSGAWNIISRMSEILSRGFDLLLANIFIGASAMGLLSVSQAIPGIILGFFGTISANFGPEFMKLYAKKDIPALKAELLRSVRITGFFACIPISVFIVYGELFYSLWLPSENATILYWLTIFGSFGSIFGMPLEPLWNIFTITNQVRKSSLNLLYNSIGIFATVYICMILIQDNIMRLYALAVIRNCFGSLRCLTFLPFYGAACLGLGKWTFYPLIIKNLINVIVIVIAASLFKNVSIGQSWSELFIGSCAIAAIAPVIAFYTILKHSDRQYITNTIKTKIHI